MARQNTEVTKPKRPKGCPLYPHSNGQWAKTILMKKHYFGPWDDLQGALRRYRAVADDLHAGREPDPIVAADGLTLKEGCNLFMNFCREKLDAGSIQPRTYHDYQTMLQGFLHDMGASRPIANLRPTDFQKYRAKLGCTQSVHTISRQIVLVKAVFKYLFASGYIRQPMNFGPAFLPPPKRLKREHEEEMRLERGLKMYDVPTIQNILAYLDDPARQEPTYLSRKTLKACILLGLNGGYTNIDCASLDERVLNLETGVIDFLRKKSKVQRYVLLWPETVTALQEAMAERPRPDKPEDKHLALLTRDGKPVLKEYLTFDEQGRLVIVSRDQFVSEDFREILKALGCWRKGISFGALRHTFRTIADEAKDDHAAKLVMGHEIPGMNGVYIQQIGEDRVRAVTEHVRQKIFTKTA
jgi:integrase